MNLIKVFSALVVSVVSMLVSRATGVNSAAFCLVATVVLRIFGLNFENRYNELLGEIAILLLMFSLGMHFEIEKIKKNKVQLITSVGFTFVLAGIAFYAIKNIMHLSYKWNLVLAFITAVASTPLTVDMLVKSGDFSNKYGQFTVLNLIIQDLIIVILLSSTEIENNKEALFLCLKILFCFFIVFFLRKIKIFNNLDNEEDGVELILVLMFALVFIAFVFHIHFELMFFALGLGLAKNNFARNINSAFEAMNTFMINMFFVSSACCINLIAFKELFCLTLSLIVTLVSIKIAVVFLLSYLNNFRSFESLKIAFSLSSISDLSFVIFKHCENTTLKFVVLNTVFSLMVLSPILFGVLSLFEPQTRIGFATRAAKKTLVLIDRYCLIIGFGNLGQKLYSRFEDSLLPVVGLDSNHNKVSDATSENKRVYCLDATKLETYNSLHNLNNCALVLICIRDHEVKKKILEKLRSVNFKCKVIVPCLNREEALQIYKLQGDAMIIDYLSAMCDEVWDHIVPIINADDAS